MPRNKDPAVLFYTSDFLVGCMGLTMEERGQYITLLCLQHQKGHLTQKEIELAVGKCSPDVLDKFEVDEHGRYYNEIMDEAIEQRNIFVESRQKNGSKGGRPKKPSENLVVSSRLTYTKPTQNLGENENINENIDIDITNSDVSLSNGTNQIKETHAKNEAPQKQKRASKSPRGDIDEVEMRFTRFWQQYPKKVAKVDAKKAFIKLNPDDDLLGVMLAALERHKTSEGWTKDGGRFIPYPATWINQRRWEDEIDTAEKTAPARFSECSPEDAFMQAINRTYGG